MRIKGTSIASFLGFVEAEYGVPRTREFVASLEPNLRKRCEGLILASAFYPFEELETLALKARDFFAAGPTFLERSGAHNASVGLAGVHRILLTRPTPFDFLRAAERGWGQFVDSGTVRAEILGEATVRVRIEGLSGSEVLCSRQTGFLRRAFELAGAKQLEVDEVACTRRGDASCDWKVVWDAASSPASQSQTHTSALRRPSTF